MFTDFFRTVLCNLGVFVYRIQCRGRSGVGSSADSSVGSSADSSGDSSDVHICCEFVVAQVLTPSVGSSADSRVVKLL